MVRLLGLTRGEVDEPRKIDSSSNSTSEAGGSLGSRSLSDEVWPLHPMGCALNESQIVWLWTKSFALFRKYRPDLKVERCSYFIEASCSNLRRPFLGGSVLHLRTTTAIGELCLSIRDGHSGFVKEAWSCGYFRWMEEATSEHVEYLIEEQRELVVDLRKRIELEIASCSCCGVMACSPLHWRLPFLICNLGLRVVFATDVVFGWV
ncbi:hypothetical protein E2542_SST13964 [Spatholobus suberectus]|nr:hypothetical protein E2542_SST13964 [Spatholobus suberectus]